MIIGRRGRNIWVSFVRGESRNVVTHLQQTNIHKPRMIFLGPRLEIVNKRIWQTLCILGWNSLPNISVPPIGTISNCKADHKERKSQRKVDNTVWVHHRNIYPGRQAIPYIVVFPNGSLT